MTSQTSQAIIDHNYDFPLIRKTFLNRATDLSDTPNFSSTDQCVVLIPEIVVTNNVMSPPLIPVASFGATTNYASQQSSQCLMLKFLIPYQWVNSQIMDYFQHIQVDMSILNSLLLVVSQSYLC